MERTNEVETPPQVGHDDIKPPYAPANLMPMSGLAPEDIPVYNNTNKSNNNTKHDKENMSASTVLFGSTPARRPSFVMSADWHGSIRPRNLENKSSKPSTLASRQRTVTEDKKPRSVTLVAKKTPVLRDPNTLASAQHFGCSPTSVPKFSQASRAGERFDHCTTPGSTVAARARGPSIRAPALSVNPSAVQADLATQALMGRNETMSLGVAIPAPPTAPEKDSGTVIPSRIPISTRYKRRLPIPTFCPSPQAAGNTHAAPEPPTSMSLAPVDNSDALEVTITSDDVAAVVNLPSIKASSTSSSPAAFSPSPASLSSSPTASNTPAKLHQAATPSAASETSPTASLSQDRAPHDDATLVTANVSSATENQDHAHSVDNGLELAPVTSADIEIPPIANPARSTEDPLVNMDDATAKIASTSGYSGVAPAHHEVNTAPVPRQLGFRHTVGKSFGKAVAAFLRRK